MTKQVTEKKKKIRATDDGNDKQQAPSTKHQAQRLYNRIDSRRSFAFACEPCAVSDERVCSSQLSVVSNEVWKFRVLKCGAYGFMYIDIDKVMWRSARTTQFRTGE